MRIIIQYTTQTRGSFIRSTPTPVAPLSLPLPPSYSRHPLTLRIHPLTPRRLFHTTLHKPTMEIDRTEKSNTTTCTMGPSSSPSSSPILSPSPSSLSSTSFALTRRLQLSTASIDELIQLFKNRASSQGKEELIEWIIRHEFEQQQEVCATSNASQSSAAAADDLSPASSASSAPTDSTLPSHPHSSLSHHAGLKHTHSPTPTPAELSRQTKRSKHLPEEAEEVEADTPDRKEQSLKFNQSQRPSNPYATKSANSTSAHNSNPNRGPPPSKKRKSTFDASQYHFRHIAFKVMYIGTNYLGFALQPSAAAQGRTIEGELLRALESTKLISSPETARLTRCGRTDKGVHSSGQVIGVYVRSRLTSGIGLQRVKGSQHVGELKSQRSAHHRELREETEGDELWEKQGFIKSHHEKDSMCPRCGVPGIGFSTDSDCTHHRGELDYVRMLNGVLPDDIRVVGWQPVGEDFSARFSCTARTYRYFFYADGMDLDRMRRAARQLIGPHDFRNFAKVDPTINTHFLRYIANIEVRTCEDVPEDCVQITAPWPCKGQQWFEDVKNQKHGDETSLAPISSQSLSPSSATSIHPDTFCELIIHGNAFLYHQVRCMAGILFLAGRGVEADDLVTRLLDLERTPNKPNYDMAPESPLVLYDTFFSALPFTPSFDYQPKPATQPDNKQPLGANEVEQIQQTQHQQTLQEQESGSSSSSSHAAPSSSSSSSSSSAPLCLYPDALTCHRNGEIVFGHFHSIWRKLQLHAKVHELFVNQVGRNIQTIKNELDKLTPTLKTVEPPKKVNAPVRREIISPSFAPLISVTSGCRGVGLKPPSTLPLTSQSPYESIFSRSVDKSYDEKVAGLKGKKRERHEMVKDLTNKFRKASSYQPKMNKTSDSNSTKESKHVDP